jgi:predicted component of type VI protein secretion system
LDSKQCHLVYLTGPEAGKARSFDAARITIGRASTCDFQFDQYRDLAVATHHAEILLDESVFFVHDLNTRGGTLVNGERINERHPLRHEDYVQFGKQGPEVIFRLGIAPAGIQPLPPPPPEFGELEFLSGADAERNFPVRGDMITRVGRRAELEISLDPRGDMVVSGNHFSISYEDGTFILTDTSRNGSFVNGAPVHHRAYLRDGDIVTLGEGGPRARFCIHPPQRIYPNRSGEFPRIENQDVDTTVPEAVAQRRAREAQEAEDRAAAFREAALRESPVSAEPPGAMAPEPVTAAALPADQPPPVILEPRHEGAHVPAVPEPHPTPVSEPPRKPTTPPAGGRTPLPAPNLFARIAAKPMVLAAGMVFIAVAGIGIFLVQMIAGKQSSPTPVVQQADYGADIRGGEDRRNTAGFFSVRVPRGWNVLENAAATGIESPDKVIAVDYVRDMRLSEKALMEILRAKGPSPSKLLNTRSGSVSLTSYLSRGASKCWLAVLHEPKGGVPGAAILEVSSDLLPRIPNETLSALVIDEFRLQQLTAPQTPAATTPAPTAVAMTSPTPLPPTPTTIPAPSPTQVAELPTPQPAATTHPAGRKVESNALGVSIDLPEGWNGTSHEDAGALVITAPSGVEMRITRDPAKLNLKDLETAMKADKWDVFYTNPPGETIPGTDRRAYALMMKKQETSYVLLLLLDQPDDSTFIIYATRQGKFKDQSKSDVQGIALQIAKQTDKKPGT